jgi:hypothetical protein
MNRVRDNVTCCIGVGQGLAGLLMAFRPSAGLLSLKQ